MKPDEARWIPGYEGKYAVTTDGRVWSCPRERTKGGWLSTSVNANGYWQVQIGRGNVHEVHRLMMRTFIGPPPAGQEVRHLDGDKLSLDLANMAYGTRSEQRYDDVRNGVHWSGSARDWRMRH